MATMQEAAWEAIVATLAERVKNNPRGELSIIATELGATRGTVSRWLSGELKGRRIPYDKMMRIMYTLGINPAHYFGQEVEQSGRLVPSKQFAHLEQSAQANQLGQLGQPNQAGQSSQSSQASQSSQSSEANQLGQLGQSNQAGQSSEANQAGQSSEANQAGQSSEANQLGQLGGAGYAVLQRDSPSPSKGMLLQEGGFYFSHSGNEDAGPYGADPSAHGVLGLPKALSNKAPLFAPQYLDDPAYYQVPWLEARASMGGGSLEVSKKVKSYLSFRRDWLLSKGPVGKMVVVSVQGDSMSPTIPDGSVLLINEAVAVPPVNGKIYLVCYREELFIKRLKVKDGRAIALVSDFDNSEVLIKKSEYFNIIGRAIWYGKDL